ncbi:Uncharacterised protein [Vibrio cholerae]|nr:Uncharacterised protein [Vibrio cholerae]
MVQHVHRLADEVQDFHHPTPPYCPKLTSVQRKSCLTAPPPLSWLAR